MNNMVVPYSCVIPAHVILPPPPSSDNIEIIQATLNSVSVNSYYKPPNQAFDFRSSTIDTPLQMIIGDLMGIQIHN